MRNRLQAIIERRQHTLLKFAQKHDVQNLHTRRNTMYKIHLATSSWSISGNAELLLTWTLHQRKVGT